MALTALDYMRPKRCLGGGATPTFAVNKEAATTWSKGDLVVTNTGYAVRGGDTAAIITILGVALEAAVADTTTALICPALPHVVFECRVATGAAGATVDTAVTQRYLSGGGSGHEIELATVFYINPADNTVSPVMIIDLVDVAGTAWGRVDFVFTSSAFNAVT
jgi:hypothetical protein